MNASLPLNEPLPLVSVIVPVWNKASDLARCLRSLEKQDYPRDKLQIVVVDNGSDDESRDVAASFKGVTVLQETNPGSYSARNLGLRNARGDYVAFIDSDCEASPRWLKAALIAAGNTNDTGIVAGRIELVIPASRAASAAAIYESVFAFNQKENAASGLCVTANWFSPRAVLERFQGFDATLKSGADTELAKRIASAGYRVVYADLAIVRHFARARLAELCAKRRRLVGGRWNALNGEKCRLLRLFLSLTNRFGGEANHTLYGPHLRTAQKLKVCLIIFTLWVTASLELIRLASGGKARRA